MTNERARQIINEWLALQSKPHIPDSLNYIQAANFLGPHLPFSPFTSAARACSALRRKARLIEGNAIPPFLMMGVTIAEQESGRIVFQGDGWLSPTDRGTILFRERVKR
jgi:hypothetical protein